MEPILLYGHPLGSATGLVAAFEWLDQPYRLSRVDMLKDMKNENYARLNGRQETPVLIADDRVITETMAIALWLEGRDTERRISFDSGDPRADQLHQFVAYLNTGFTAAFSPYWAALEMTPPDPELQSALRRFGHAQVNDRHAKLEAMMGETPYLLADRPTLADAVFAGVARWADFHQAIDAKAYPRISALKARLEREPSFQFALALENGDTPKGSGAMKGQIPLRDVLAAHAAKREQDFALLQSR